MITIVNGGQVGKGFAESIITSGSPEDRLSHFIRPSRRGCCGKSRPVEEGQVLVRHVPSVTAAKICMQKTFP